MGGHSLPWLRRGLGLTSGLALASLVAPGCGETGRAATTGHTDAGIDAFDGGDLEADRRDALHTWAAALCAGLAKCDASTTQQMPDSATCADRLANAQFGVWFARGSKVTPDALRACAAAFPTDCEEWYSYVLERRYPAPCAEVMSGSLADGSPCFFAAQCASGACTCQAPYCSNGSPCGACGPASALGGACIRDDDCLPGLACAAGSCAAYGKLGDACSAAAPCAHWLRCESSKCTARGQVGASCTTDDDCAFNPDPLVCHPVAHTCVATTLATKAGVCGWTASGYVRCAPDFGCLLSDPTQPASTGTCTELHAPGAACLGGAWGPPPTDGCEFSSACIAGVCQWLDASMCDQIPYPP